MATLAAVEELEQVLGEVQQEVTVTVKGKPQTVTVTPFRLRQFANVLRCVRRLMDGGVISGKELAQVKEAESGEEAAGKFDMVRMFLEGGDEVINILQIAVGQQIPAHTLDGLDLVSATRLASAVFAVNLDFFYQNRETIQAALSPAIEAVEGLAQGGLEALGQPPQTDSEAPDTP
jgi:hypothetical protein